MTDPVKMQCPSCGKTAAARPEVFAKELKCPACMKVGHFRAVGDRQDKAASRGAAPKTRAIIIALSAACLILVASVGFFAGDQPAQQDPPPVAYDFSRTVNFLRRPNTKKPDALIMYSVNILNPSSRPRLVTVCFEELIGEKKATFSVNSVYVPAQASVRRHFNHIIPADKWQGIGTYRVTANYSNQSPEDDLQLFVSETKKSLPYFAKHDDEALRSAGRYLAKKLGP